MCERKYRMAGVVEIWKDVPCDWNLKMNGYSLFLKERMWKRGGEVVLYIKDTITCYRIIDDSQTQDSECL